jgi:hypothetical protein
MLRNHRMAAGVLACVLSAGAALALCALQILPAQASAPTAGRPAAESAAEGALPANWQALPTSWHGYAPKNVQSDAYCRGASAVYSRNSGKVFEVYGSSTKNGATVDQWVYNGSATQHWCFFVVGYFMNTVAIYEVVNNHSGKCLDLENGSTKNGARVQQWTCNGHDNQHWLAFIVNNSYYMFAPATVPNGNLGYLYVLDVSGASKANGAKIDIWTSHLGKNQEWCSGPC